MNFQLLQYLFQRVFLSTLFCFGCFAAAQPAGLLYDPEPPADSAYIRVIHASRDGAIDILVDGRLRISKLGTGEASDYMVLGAGKRVIAVHSAGKPTASLTTTLEVVPGRAMTVALTTMRAGSAPVLFEDKANSNKLKAILAVYHLDADAGPLDILSADGNTKVFSGVSFGSPAFLQVNPIAVDLVAVKAGSKESRASTSLSMTQGGTYSILLLPGAGGKPIARALQNKIERYSGK
ncbi:MAG: DUF4397 domain-containing protein [Rhodoferax sp.]